MQDVQDLNAHLENAIPLPELNAWLWASAEDMHEVNCSQFLCGHFE